MKSNLIRVLGILIFLTGNLNAQNSNNIKPFLSEVFIEGLINYSNLDQNLLETIQSSIALKEYDFSNIEEEVSYLINAYNCLVILEIARQYPVQSVEQIPGFFTRSHTVAGRSYSLNDIETRILDLTGNPSIHFALNCGAISCPEIRYVDEINLHATLNQLAKVNLNKQKFLIVDDKKKQLNLGKIFFWFKGDFQKYSSGVAAYISQVTQKDLRDYKITYMEYNWALNDQSYDVKKEQQRFYPVKLYQKGEVELKIFNNYYTQTDLNPVNNSKKRSSYFSSFIQLLLGSNKHFNLGFDVKVRSVELLNNSGSIFHALSFNSRSLNTDGAFARSGISMIGPRIKYQPFKDKPNINFLHSLYFSTIEDAEGDDSYGFVDFDGLQIYNQVYYEKILGPRSTLFIDAGIFLEGLKFSAFQEEGAFTQISIPATGIYSYYPNNKTTLYFLAGVGPKIGLDNKSDTLNTNLDAYAQLGPGLKYFISTEIELEFLYTQFINSVEGQKAATFNFGIRYQH